MGRLRGVAAIACLAALMVAGCAWAQRQPGGGNQPGGGRFDPAQFREQRLNQIKEQIGASDQEWQVLKPKVEKVMDIQNQSRTGFGMGRGRGGTGGTTEIPADASPVMKAYLELRNILQDPNAKTPDITAKLNAYRTARTQAQEELKNAQKALKELLTPKQEAQLVLQGLLE